MNPSFIEFLASHSTAFLALHLIGVALGMGGATITDILFFNFLRDFRIARKEAEVMRILSNIIMCALGLLLLSGAALFASDIETYGNSPTFIAKAFIVVVISVNGVLMHKYVAPRMMHMSFVDHPFQSAHIRHRLRPVAFAMGAVSFVSWYSAFFIAMLKTYIPAEATYVHILSVYVAILAVAIAGSQIMQYKIGTRSLLQ